MPLSGGNTRERSWAVGPAPAGADAVILGGDPGNVQNNPRVVLRGCGRRLRPFFLPTSDVATGQSTSMDLADCRLRAMREVPGGALTTPYMRENYATTCMVAKGYRME